MANSSTLVDTIPSRVGGLSPVYEYEIVIDTVDSDLTVRTISSSVDNNNRIWVVGMWLSEGTAANVTFKTATKSQTFELAANQALPGFVEKSWLFVTGKNENLVFRSSAAIGSTVGKNLIIRVVEGPTFNGDQ